MFYVFYFIRVIINDTVILTFQDRSYKFFNELIMIVMIALFGQLANCQPTIRSVPPNGNSPHMKMSRSSRTGMSG